jgi:hypothetical protein
LSGCSLDGGNLLPCALVAASGLRALLGVDALILALAATASAALGLAHAMLHVLWCKLRLSVLLAGRHCRTLVGLYLGYILL